MKQRCQLGVMALVANERVGLENRSEPLAWIATMVSECSKLLEVAGDSSFMPGDQDRFNVREVLVQGRPSNAGVLGNLRHGHRSQAVLGHQRHGGVQNRV